MYILFKILWITLYLMLRNLFFSRIMAWFLRFALSSSKSHTQKLFLEYNALYTFFNISPEKSQNQFRTTVGFFTVNLWLNEIWKYMNTSPLPGTSLIFEILSGKFILTVKKLFINITSQKWLILHYSIGFFFKKSNKRLIRCNKRNQSLLRD